MIHFQNTIFKKKISIPINISYDGILKHGKVIRCDSFVSCFTYRESWRRYCTFIVFIQNHCTFSMLIVCHLTFIWILCGLLDECFPFQFDLSIVDMLIGHLHWFLLTFDLICWCLTPLPAICQLYHGDKFWWWKNSEYPERTIDHG